MGSPDPALATYDESDPDQSDPDESDRRLLADHVAGDAEAFGVLFTRHRDRLWAVALRTTGDPELAADALQDAMVAAFRRAATYRGDARVTTWLHRVVVNACLDRLRRARVRAADPLPDDLDRALSPGSSTGDLRTQTRETAADPATTAERHELRHRLLAALQELPIDQRAALVLVDLEGLSVQEAGEVLEVPPGTIKSRCSRGRARLAGLLGDLRDDAPEGTGPAPGASHSSTGPDAGPAAREVVGP